MSRLSKSITVMILVLTLGLHWALMQSVAWVTMVVRYSQHMPLTSAIAQTFDGLHPCILCQFIDTGKKSEQQREKEQGFTMQKLELVIQAAADFPIQIPVSDPFDTLDTAGSTRVEKPPLQPPRTA